MVLETIMTFLIQGINRSNNHPTNKKPHEFGTDTYN